MHSYKLLLPAFCTLSRNVALRIIEFSRHCNIRSFWSSNLSERKIKERWNIKWKRWLKDISHWRVWKRHLSWTIVCIHILEKIPINCARKIAESTSQPEKSRLIGGIIFAPLFKQSELSVETGTNKREKWSSGK